MKKQAEKASRMPSFENTFRNLNLNQRVSTVSPFVSKSVWEENGGAGDASTVEVWYGGLDLSARTDLTSFVMVGRDANGLLVVEPYFWTPEKGLYDRARTDRQPYDIWVKQGLMRTTPGATVDYEFVVADMAEIIDDRHVQALAFDRWRIDVFKKECERMEIEFPMIEFGQGFKDMSPALDNLEAELLNGKIAHEMNAPLTMCAANAVVTKDPAGNRKLDKHKAVGRIDGMVALAMAVGVMEKEVEQEPPSPWDDESFSIL